MRISGFRVSGLVEKATTNHTTPRQEALETEFSDGHGLLEGADVIRANRWAVAAGRRGRDKKGDRAGRGPFGLALLEHGL